MQLSERRELLAGGGAALGALFVYLLTLGRSINFIDSGELAAVAYTLGVAHPTGYPLFTLVGWLFAHAPFGMRAIQQLNIMAALFCAGAVFFFFRFLLLVLHEAASPSSGAASTRHAAAAKTPPHESLAILAAALSGTLYLAFSKTFWSQGVSIEVYSLHVFFLALLLFLFFKALKSGGHTPERAAPTLYGERYWLAFALMLGVSFTNHMTTILLAPGMLYAFFAAYGFSAPSFKRIGRMVIPFLVGFSVYLYLPVRAAQGPMLNWGNPVTFERFLWHFSGKQYRVWLFSSTESAMKQLTYFAEACPAEFAYLPGVLAVVGCIALFRVHRKTWIFTMLLFAGCVLYSINYDIHDIDSYFLLAYFIVALWAAFGVKVLVGALRHASQRKWAALGFLLIAVLVLGVNYRKVDQSKNVLVEEYAKNLLEHIEPNGVVLSYQWDYFISAAYYLQRVENYRPDVTIIDKELLRRSWYFAQLDRMYPWLSGGVREEISSFMEELYKFEHGIPYNPNIIEGRYTQLIQGIIKESSRTRRVYVTQEIEPQYTTGYRRIPSGLAYRLTADTTDFNSPIPEFTPTLPRERDKYVNGIITMYGQAYTNTALFLNYSGKREEALALLEKALVLQPDFREAALIKEQILSSGGILYR